MKTIRFSTRPTSDQCPLCHCPLDWILDTEGYSAVCCGEEWSKKLIFTTMDLLL